VTLVVRDLTVRIGGRAVVDSVSFTLADGARLGIIGESGSGKSITALAILGLLPDGATATGSVELDGRELLGLPDVQLAKVRGKQIGVVFQEPRTALNPIRTLGRQLSEPLRIHDGMNRTEAKAAAIELARMVRLSEPERMVKLYPHQVSGGQRQRIGIGIALAANPTVLLADEPTTALDVTIQAEILALFDRLVAERGTSMVFITHDLAVLTKVASEVIVMAHGKVVERGSVSSILNAPQSPITQGLVAASIATGWKAL
jgi:peptide/nickel transport system ATP-binding protein